MALTADGLKYFSPEPRFTRSVDVPDGTTRYADEFVAWDADNTLRGYSPRADYRFFGVNLVQAVASTSRLINGEHPAVVAYAGGVMRDATITGLATTSLGKFVYADANDGLTLTPTHPLVPPVGEVIRVISASGDKGDVRLFPADYVEFDPIKRMIQAAQAQGRFVYDENFYALPVAGAAGTTFDLQGTNAAAITHAEGGGWALTTGSTGNDQTVLIGEAAGSVAGGLEPRRAGAVLFLFETGSSIADRQIMAGLSLTAAIDGTTDADKLVISYDSGASTANFRVLHSENGTDSTAIDTGVACTADTTYCLAVCSNAAGEGEVYLGTGRTFERVASGLTMTAAATLLPMFGVETETAAAASGQILRRAVLSMDYAA